MSKKRIGVVLCGCGKFDGSEVHESVLTLLAIDRAGHQAVCFAPNVNQYDVVDHLTGKPTGETRNALVEAARIARGQITDLAEARATDLDAVIIPGGQGAAKNLCQFNITGTDCPVHPEAARLVLECLDQGKPLGAICIAPSLLSAVLRDDDRRLKLTIGTDQSVAAKLTSMGTDHVACPVRETVVDTTYKVVSTPAYMLADNISDVAAGIEKLVAQVIELI